MKISDLDIDKKYLRITDFENFFNVYQDKKGNYFYNINTNMYLDIAEDVLDEYVCTYDMQWPLISYKLYGTTRLAWLLMKINKVQPKDVFKLKHPGDVVKYIEKQQMLNLVAEINGFNT